jgi:hypothetical protein
LCAVIQHVGKYLTGFANLHLFLPTPLYSPCANGSVNKPAKISGFKFPGWTPFLLVGRAFLDHPAWFAAFAILTHQRNKEIHLSFNRGRYGSPDLLVAVDSLYRDPEQLSHLLLGLVQFLAKMDEFLAIHGEFRGPVN